MSYNVVESQMLCDLLRDGYVGSVVSKGLAQEIVTACNAHADLLAALENLLYAVDPIGDGGVEDYFKIPAKDAHAAIAKAKEES